MVQGTSDLMSALMGNAVHGKSGKTGKADAILALFAEALTAQLGGVADAKNPKALGLSLIEGVPAVAGEVKPELDLVGELLPQKGGVEGLPAVADVSAQMAMLAQPVVVPVVVPVVPVVAGDSLVDVEVTDLDGMDALLAGKGQKLPHLPAENALAAMVVKADKLGADLGVDSDLLGQLRAVLSEEDARGLGLSVKELVESELVPLAQERPVVDVPAGASMSGMVAKMVSEGVTSGRFAGQLAAPLASPQWVSELGDRLVWLAGRQGSVAELTLTPPSLGSVEVRLNMSGNEAGAQFFSANPNVRDALEAALPRLREMLAAAGLSLGDAMVSGEAFTPNQGGTAQSKGGGEEEGEDLPSGVDSSVMGGRVRIARGLVDLYA